VKKSVFSSLEKAAWSRASLNATRLIARRAAFVMPTIF
jgi:hypothetical protein